MDELMRRASAGDGTAFAELFNRERDALWRAARAVMGNDEDAADALQEAALRAWQAASRFKGRCSARTWLTRIVLNTCFDARRQAKREAPAELEPNASEPASEAWEAFSDQAIDVQRALAKLNDDDRAILALFYANDLSVRDIGRALDLSDGAVRTRLSRARTRFKDAYTKDAGTPNDPNPTD